MNNLKSEEAFNFTLNYCAKKYRNYNWSNQVFIEVYYFMYYVLSPLFIMTFRHKTMTPTAI